MTNVDLSRVPPFYHKYISFVSENDLDSAFKKHQADFISLLKKISSDQWDHRYAEGKWSVKELVQHVIDAERIFCYRALRFARKDKTELHGFDEGKFAAASKADKRTREDLLDELATVQKSSAQLFASFDEDQLDQQGTANGSSVYVKALGYIITGHALHHQNILTERYINKKPSAV